MSRGRFGSGADLSNNHMDNGTLNQKLVSGQQTAACKIASFEVTVLEMWILSSL